MNSSRPIRTVARTNRLRAAATLLAVVAVAACKNAPFFEYQRIENARRIAAELRIELSKSAEASNRAVMAITDEESAAFAGEAAASTREVTKGVEALDGLLAQLEFAHEKRLLADFRQRFSEYEELDRTILGLAVENTNLKAQRISFGPARAAAEALRRELDAVAASAPPVRACRVQALAVQAVLGVREIEVLQAPHIAAADDATMARLEAGMAAARRTAQENLDAVGALAEPAARPHVEAARNTLDRFLKANDEVVRLSRRNSNVRSLALSLGRKRNVTAECDAVLAALQQALGQHGSKATR